MPTKEEIYDEQISPLMEQVIAICSEHKIANVCSFALDAEEGLQCTTMMVGEEYERTDALLACSKVAMGEPVQSPLMMTITDGEGNVKESHAIL